MIYSCDCEGNMKTTNEFHDEVLSYILSHLTISMTLTVQKSRLGNFNGLFSLQKYVKDELVCVYYGMSLSTKEGKYI